MMKNIHTLLILCSTFGLAACGGSTGVSSALQAKQLSTLALAQIQGLKPNGAPSLSQVPGANIGSTISLVATCVESTVASPVDADADGIPLNQTYKYRCKNEALGTSIYSFVGGYTIKDRDDTKKWMEGGYDGTYEYASELKSPATAGTPAFSGSYIGRGQYTAQKLGPSYVMDSTYSGSVKYDSEGYVADYQYEGTWGSKWTPDSAVANMWLKGTSEYAGTWHYFGMLPPQDEDQQARRNASKAAVYIDVTMKMYSENLVYDNTCTNYYRSGSWIFDFGDGHSFKWTYGCTTLKYYLDGKEFDPSAAI
jgi:hypothetical protein